MHCLPAFLAQQNRTFWGKKLQGRPFRTKWCNGEFNEAEKSAQLHWHANRFRKLFLLLNLVLVVFMIYGVYRGCYFKFIFQEQKSRTNKNMRNVQYCYHNCSNTINAITRSYIMQPPALSVCAQNKVLNRVSRCQVRQFQCKRRFWFIQELTRQKNRPFGECRNCPISSHTGNMFKHPELI